MSGLSNFYSESVKKLRSSYLSSGSPCNSDEDSKQKFIDRVKSKSKRISKTVASDFGTNNVFFFTAKISRKISMIADQKDG
ncbi:hypothetical protein cypCar_00036225 [Cyprinus carpio]|nr:hypothetical protein cypCar_00036225 [Cyprinus carpio]